MKNADVFKNETVNIKTLSPLHIGTGIKLGNWDYYVKDKKVFVISLDKFAETLTEKQQDTLVNYMENNKSIQDFVDDYKLFENIKGSIKYEIPIKDISKKFFGIWEEIKHPAGLYLPASTVKGAIRTAILYCLLKENKDKYQFSVKEFINENTKKKYKDIVLNNNIVGASNIENFLDREFFGENQANDVFKFFKVSDSLVLNGFSNLELRKIYIANTTQFETKLPNGKKIQKHPEYYETIKENTIFEGIKVSVINSQHLEKFIKEKYQKTLEKIKNWKLCVYEFTKDLIDAEIAFWKNEDVEKNINQTYGNSPHQYISYKFNKEEVIDNLEKIKAENTQQEPVIRLGKLTGYFTHSIGLLLAKNKDKPYDIHEFGKIFNKRAKDYLFPLTRRLTLDNQTLGWCKLPIETKEKVNQEIKEKPKSPEDLYETLAKKWGGKLRR